MRERKTIRSIVERVSGGGREIEKQIELVRGREGERKIEVGRDRERGR